MSEEQITMVKKEKNPKRVEAGRKLAAYNKSAKGNVSITEDTKSTEDSENSGIGVITVLTGIGVISGLVCLYFTYKQDKRAETEVKVVNGAPQKLRSFNN